MARRKKHAGHENHERWLVSYADFITLLFAFFVVMFASSQADKGKAQQVAQSVRNALENGGISPSVVALFGGSPDNKGEGNAQMRGPGGAQKSISDGEGKALEAQLVPAMEFLVRELHEEIQTGKMTVSMEPRGLVVSFRQAAFFPSGEDVIDPSTIGSFEKVAATILKLPNPVRLEGHTDSVPIHNARFRSNWDLSAARSIAMLTLFTTRCQVPPGRLSIAAYAENAPADSNETEEGRARNRRVDIVLLNALGTSAEPQHSLDAPPPEPPPQNPAAAARH